MIQNSDFSVCSLKVVLFSAPIYDYKHKHAAVAPAWFCCRPSEMSIDNSW